MDLIDDIFKTGQHNVEKSPQSLAMDNLTLKRDGQIIFWESAHDKDGKKKNNKKK